MRPVYQVQNWQPNLKLTALNITFIVNDFLLYKVATILYNVSMCLFLQFSLVFRVLVISLTGQSVL